AHVDREQAAGREQHRVAIGRRARDRGAGDAASGAGAVLDHHWLFEDLLHLLGEDARHHVARPAGREADHQRDRVARIVGCACERRRPDKRGARQKNHGCLHRLLRGGLVFSRIVDVSSDSSTPNESLLERALTSLPHPCVEFYCPGAPIATGRTGEPAAPCVPSGRMMLQESQTLSRAMAPRLAFWMLWMPACVRLW